LLVAGTEHGVMVTFDDGAAWVSLQGDLPTVAIHDLLIHPREHDLVVGTHGRGIWVLDDVGMLAAIAADGLAAPVSVLSTRGGMQLNRFDRGRSSRGDTFYAAPNAPAGAVIDLWVAAGGQEGVPAPVLLVRAADGEIVRRFEVGSEGVQRVLWDLRYEPAWVDPEGSPRRSVPGPWVLPGEYRVELTRGESSATASVEVFGDPAVAISSPDRRLWHDTLRQLARRVAAGQAARLAVAELIDELEVAAGAVANSSGEETLVERVATLEARAREARDGAGQSGGALARLYRAVSAATSRPTVDQLVLLDREDARLGEAIATINLLQQEELPALRRSLDDAGVGWTPGRPIGR
jgi:hypothetical protein